jgi:hypothetical protein
MSPRVPALFEQLGCMTAKTPSHGDDGGRS